MNVEAIFNDNNAEATTGLYATLQAIGPAGIVATNLLRASKNSGRAKVYRRRKATRAAYETKNWAIGQLCAALAKDATSLEIVYGWQRDETTEGYSWVLYVDLPTGQVSYHAPSRGDGPDYAAKWDGQRGESHGRVIRWAQAILDAHPDAKPQPAPGRDAPVDDETPMMFGKYKGMPLKDVPAEYLEWLSGQDLTRYGNLRTWIRQRLMYAGLRG